MGVSKNSYEKKRELDTYSYADLLAVGAPDIKFYHTARGLESLCPFHDDKKLGSFFFNPQTGVWKCFACGESGQGVISFVMRLNGWDFLRALDYLYEHRNDARAAYATNIPQSLKAVPGAKKSGINVQHATSEKAKFIGHDPASAEDRHLIYQAFADASPLSDYERNCLLAERRIYYGTSFDFCHMPNPDDADFWARFRKLLSRYDEYNQQERLYYSLLGVPGFYWDEQKDRLSFVTYPYSLGMLLHSPAGKIVGIDIRVPGETASGARYIGFSSGSICTLHPEQCSFGAKLQAFVDVVPRVGAKNKGVAVTEGRFKAIQLSYRGYTALNVRGVGNWKHVLKILSELPDDGPVTIAFDADCRRNPAVAQCASKLGHALLKAGYEVQYLTWDAKYGKGFDDLCNNGLYNKSRIVPGEKFLSTTLDPFLARAAKRREQERLKKQSQPI